MTSAFLQILATIHNVEACRVSNPRNILSILSTNTRRTKVVEMSTGTHRVVRRLAIALEPLSHLNHSLALTLSLTLSLTLTLTLSLTLTLTLTPLLSG